LPGMPVVFWPVVMAVGRISRGIWGERIAMSMWPPNSDLVISTFFQHALVEISTP